MKNQFTKTMKVIPLTAFVFAIHQGVEASTVESTIDTTGLPGTISLSLGDHTANSSISSGVEVDGYTFSGTAGQSIRIVAAGRTGFYDPQIELRNPSGTVLQTIFCTGSSAGCSTNLDQTLTETGTYFVNISDSGANESGNYVLHLDEYPPQNNWTGLAYDTTISEALGHYGDHDYLAFSGSAGTGVRFSLQGLTGFLDPHLQVWDPSGNTLEVDLFCTGSSGGCSIVSDLNITSSGIYRLAVFDQGLNEIGNYDINLSCTFGACPTAAPTVPVPAAVWLFGSGLIGLIGIARRKKA